MSATTSLTPALSPRRGRTVRRVFGNTGDGTGRTVCRITEGKPRRFLLPGGEGQDEGGRQNPNSGSFFQRSHKVIVALTVQEILDEHIAKRLA
jgi:hypothetical protein